MAFEVRYDGGMAAPGAAMSYKAGKGMFDQWLAGMQMQRDRMAQSDQQLMARGMMDSLGRQQQFSQEQQLLQMRDKLGKDAFDYEITAKQKQKWDSLNAELDWIDEQKDWDADQKAYARDAVRSQMIGLGQKRIVPKKDTTPIAEQFKARSYVDEYGTTWMLQPDKTFKPQMAPKQDSGQTQQDPLKLKEAISKRVDQLMKLKNADGGLIYTHRQAWDTANREFGEAPPNWGSSQSDKVAQAAWNWSNRLDEPVPEAAQQGIQQAVEQQEQRPSLGGLDYQSALREAKSVLPTIKVDKLNEPQKKLLKATEDRLKAGDIDDDVMMVIQFLKAQAG